MALIVSDTRQFEYDWFKPKQPRSSAGLVEDALLNALTNAGFPLETMSRYERA
jgi:hypothetical protein